MTAEHVFEVPGRNIPDAHCFVLATRYDPGTIWRDRDCTHLVSVSHELALNATAREVPDPHISVGGQDDPGVIRGDRYRTFRVIGVPIPTLLVAACEVPENRMEIGRAHV